MAVAASLVVLPVRGAVVAQEQPLEDWEMVEPQRQPQELVLEPRAQEGLGLRMSAPSLLALLLELVHMSALSLMELVQAAHQAAVQAEAMKHVQTQDAVLH